MHVTLFFVRGMIVLMYYIYILYSAGSDRYYLGYSDNPMRRLTEHNTSVHLSYTFKHRPWEMKGYFEVGKSRKDAIRIERYLKKQKSRKIIEKILREGSISEIKTLALKI